MYSVVSIITSTKIQNCIQIVQGLGLGKNSNIKQSALSSPPFAAIASHLRAGILGQQAGLMTIATLISPNPTEAVFGSSISYHNLIPTNDNNSQLKW